VYWDGGFVVVDVGVVAMVGWLVCWLRGMRSTQEKEKGVEGGL
jgi:hypothetical protein